MDYAQLVIDDELIGMAKYVLGGITVNDETLAVNTIREVGIGKDYLSHEHTFQHMRSAQTAPSLIDRRTRTTDDWSPGGETNIYNRAWKKALTIMDTYQPKPLSNEVAMALKSIVAETEAVIQSDKEKKEQD